MRGTRSACAGSGVCRRRNRFAASGSLHPIAGSSRATRRLAAADGARRSDRNRERRSGATSGRIFSDCTALGHAVAPGAGIAGGAAVQVVAVAGSAPRDGAPRAAASSTGGRGAGRRCRRRRSARRSVWSSSASKTGMIAPSIGCAMDLRRRFADAVDACWSTAAEFRLAPTTLANAYLGEQGLLWIALTGSKFVGGPAFAGALLLPDAAARRLRGRELGVGLCVIPPAPIGRRTGRCRCPRWRISDCCCAGRPHSPSCGPCVRCRSRRSPALSMRSPRRRASGCKVMTPSSRCRCRHSIAGRCRRINPGTSRRQSFPSSCATAVRH